MQNYLTFYLFWLAAPVAISYFSEHPAVLGVAVLAFLLRNRLPDPILWLKNYGKIRSLRHQIDLNPSNLRARRDLTWFYLQRRQARQAADVIAPALEREPDSLELLSLLGRAQVEAKQYDAAVETLTKSTTADPKFRYGEAFGLLATALMALGRPDEAEAALKSQLKAHSSSVEAWYRVAGLRSASGDKDGAKKAWHEAKRTYRSLPPFQRRNQWGWYARSSLRALV